MLILSIVVGVHSSAQVSKAKTVKTTFSRETAINVSINASPEIVWNLLTNGADYSRWNSTIISIEGTIELGEKIKLKSTLDENRTFKLKIKEVIPKEKLVWGDGKGNRIYTIEKRAEGGVRFFMSEKIGGVMFPMYAKYIPPFDASFEAFAADLKKEAELIQKSTK